MDGCIEQLGWLQVINWVERKLYMLVTWILVGKPERIEDYVEQAAKDYRERLAKIQAEEHE